MYGFGRALLFKNAMVFASPPTKAGSREAVDGGIYLGM